ncbi:MAG: GNAT family N-acetyltransferase, partial [Candidatus Arcticimaribacter sp.]
ASIGRVVTSPSVRGKSYGHALVDFSIAVCKKNFPGQAVKISAQAHLEKFYNEHGFKATGESYLEDDIPHIGMILE